MSSRSHWLLVNIYADLQCPISFPYPMSRNLNICNILSKQLHPAFLGIPISEIFRGLVFIIPAQLHSMKVGLRFSSGLNPSWRFIIVRTSNNDPS